ncbi:hypothetical protein ACFPVT_07535 [Corynebacterium choanae]|uniref:Cell division protein FtsL n=1 Tax=Corynebacterium choanae TaxID=1862358 RepID=A0A3G6J768_9CORY|nr:hypothetical protein [Corynebacterium choanae]AZA13955.1 Cell division protein FtsL [Corynebacterium choanae]
MTMQTTQAPRQSHRVQQAATSTRTPVLPRPSTVPRTFPQRHPVPQRIPSTKPVRSIRGRRVVTEQPNPTKVRFVLVLLAVLITGLSATMYLSGVTAQQTFQIAQLTEENVQLDNQLETLRRDVELASSSASIARNAADAGLVVADQPGIIAVDPAGAQTVLREPDPAATRPIIDVNGQQVRPIVATSDPAQTEGLTDQRLAPQQPVVVPGVPQLDAVAPYAPNTPASRSGAGQ